MDLLPHFAHISRDNAHGRNPLEGYQRGVGLRSGEVFDKLIVLPDFQEAYALADGRTVCALIRLMNIYLLMTVFMPKLKFGHIIEVGSYRGGSAMFMAKVAQTHLPGVQVFALDSFEGMPETDSSIDLHIAKNFADTIYEEVEAAKTEANLTNLHLVKGLFENTAPEVIQRAGSIALAHIDCDIYEPAAYAWNQVEPAMVGGGYVVFDDATEPSCLGAMQAIEEIVCRHNLRSEQVDPHFVFRYPPL